MSLPLADAGVALRTREGARTQLLLPVADVLTMLACFTLGGLVNFSYGNVTEERTLILVLLTAACLAAFHYFGHYSRRRPFWQELGDILTVAVIAFVFDAALLYLLKVNFSRLWVLTSWALVVPAIPLGRRLVKRVCPSSAAGSSRRSSSAPAAPPATSPRPTPATCTSATR
jgi:hypothetical protein